MAAMTNKYAAPVIGLAAVLAMCAAAAAQVTIDPVVTSIGSLRDPVPGREAPFVFRGESNVQLPVMNDSHDVVFRARSASEFDNNAGIAWGIYVKRPGDPLAVLVDTTVDAGTPGFPVPGRPAGARFTDFKAPLVNGSGDVVFHATFFDASTSLTRTGIYATHVSGGPLVKIVDAFDTVPGAGAATYSTFIFSSASLQDLTPAALNDNGDVAFWALFDGSATSGLFGSSVSGGTVVQLADRTITPSGVPFGTPQPFLEIRPTMAMNGSGQVAFHGSIRINSPTGPIRNGVFRVPVSGGTPPVTVAFQFQTAPDAGTVTFSNFSEEDIDENGRVVFVAGLSDATSGFYSTDTPGGPFTRLVDTRVGGPDVPGDIAAAEFDALLLGPINESGQSGFWARIRNSATANNQGIYRSEVGVTTIGFVQDAAATAPGLSAPARLTQFADLGAAINEAANLLFAGTGVDELGAGMRGLYLYDACADGVARIVDSTISAAELGGTFSTLGTQTRKLSAYQGGHAVSGRFSALTEDNRVAFLAQFDNFDFGIYVATVTSSGSGGGLVITCPDNVSLECPADTSPAVLGEATAVDSCSGASVATTFEDVTSTGCGTTGTITRTWSADDGFGNIVTCEQIIDIGDTVSPELVGVPADTSAECDDVPAPAAVTATDACDASPMVSLDEATVEGDCPDDFTLTRTWTATDACGNSASADQSIEVSDTTPPDVTCPADQLGLACNSDTSPASSGEATGSDNCGDVTLGFSDDTTPGCGDTVSIARTWTASDECDNETSCVQAISTVDNTPPVLNLDTTPIVVSDADCSGSEVVTLPVATATDDCGDATVSNDAPAAFPAGETTTVTFTAEDECGNTADASVDVTVENSTTIAIDAQRFVVGLGSFPGVTQEPIADIEVCAYERGSGSCAAAACGIFHAILFQCILDNCPPVACATTDANGYAEIPVPPGKYVAIASDETFLILPSPLGGLVEDLSCGETELVRLRQLSLPNGKKLSAKITRLLGSELLIIEPEEILWDNTEQLYPFVFESVGDWDVTVAVAPPEGFVADHDSLSTTVQSDERAVQFVITEVGSDLVPTQTTFNVIHNGEKRLIRSQVGIKLTAEYAKSRGFDVAELRQKGLIKEHPVPVTAEVELKPQSGASLRK